jgi:2-methylcitrate dehydratase PrpD
MGAGERYGPARAYLGDKIAGFASGLHFEDIPARVVEKVKVCLLFNLGIAVAGYSIIPDVLKAVSSANCAKRGGARIFVCGTEVAAADAAFANAAMMHARTQDDFQHAAHSHIGAVAIPAALALCEWRDLGGRELIAGLAVAYQVATVLGRESAAIASSRGFRPSGLFAMVGATACCARVLGLDPVVSRNATCLAANFASGLNQTWLAGTDEWRLHIANASRNAVFSTILAEAGHNAAADTFEGTSGFFAAHTGQVPNTSDLAAELAAGWCLDTVGFKPLPICGINLGPAENALRLARTKRVCPEDIRAMEIVLPTVEAAVAGIAATGPINGVGAALMRTAYVVATCLVTGRLQYGDLVNRNNPAILSLCDKITVSASDELAPMSHILRIRSTRGVIEESFNQSSADFAFDRTRARQILSNIADELALPFSKIHELEDRIWSLDSGTAPASLVAALLR